MDVKERKEKILLGFEKLGEGDSEALMSLFSNDIKWTIIGSTKFSGQYDGIQDVTERLLTPIHEALDGGITLTAENLIGEGDYIVCQGFGKSKLVTGGNYNNIYCWVYRWSGEQIVEVKEYLDTHIVEKAFG